MKNIFRSIIFGLLLISLALSFLGFGIAKAQVIPTSTGLADSPWPMFHGNIRGTGLSKYDTSKIDGTIKWQIKLGSQTSTSPVLASDGTIYIGGEDCNLHAINPDGTEKWIFDAGEPVFSQEWNDYSCMRGSPVVNKDGTIYIVALSNFMFAISPDGKEKWRYPVYLFTDVWSSPVIGSDGTIYVGSEEYPPPRVSDKPMEVGGSFYAINPDGTLKWTYDSKSAGMTSTAAIDKDEVIYTSGGDFDKDVGTFVNTIFAFNSDGSIKWKFRPEGVVEGSAALGEDGTIYIGVKGKDDPKNGKFYALNPDGSLKWQIPFYGGMSVTPAIGKDGTLYLGNWEGTFYALTADGKEKWHFDTPKATETLSSSPAIGADGTIYFGSIANAFYALNPDGSEKWKMDAPGGGIISSPAIGSDNVIYIASIPGTLYAIGASDTSNKNITTNTTKQAPNWLLIIIIGSLLAILVLALILYLKRKKITGWIILLIIIALILAYSAYASFTKDKILQTSSPTPATATSTSGEQQEKETPPKIDDATCPDHVYGKNQDTYYGTLSGAQWDLSSKQVEWIKANCPKTIWPDK